MLNNILNHPFTWGLSLGLLLCLYISFNAWLKLRKVRKEKDQLHKHLQTKMELEAESSGLLKERTEKLRQENENLRITVQTLRGKPSRKELELLYIYDKTLQIMFERAPGFASAWQGVRNEVEGEVEKAHKGIVPMLKKAFGRTSPFLALEGGKENLDDDEENEEGEENESPSTK